MKKLLIITFFLITMGACGGKKRGHSDCRTCKDFATQAQAKNYAKSHPKCKRELDSDRDGRYCEDLPQ
jgi:hypothetical protein